MAKRLPDHDLYYQYTILNVNLENWQSTWIYFMDLEPNTPIYPKLVG